MDTLKQVLLAIDGSEHSEVTTALAAAVRWPVGTTLEVLEVSEPLMPESEMGAQTLADLARRVREQVDADLALARSRLVARVPQVETATRFGRPASEIVREAERIGADLVIVGGRGKGPLATMLLGSVASEVVDRAPCPVLVARGRTLERIVVADDGSAAGASAVQVAGTWRIFKGLGARVVSVAPVYASTSAGPVRHEPARQDYAEAVDALRRTHDLIARDVAAELTRAGVPAASEMRFGDPADQIIRAAIEHGADLVVIGSRGQSGLERLLTGSVARNVLTHAPTSVLIVRRQRARSRRRNGGASREDAAALSALR